MGRLFWYCRLDDGLHQMLGDQVIQDEAISGAFMIDLIDCLKERYQSYESKVEVVEFGIFAFVAYLGALRRNKVAMVNLGAMRKLRDLMNRSQEEFPMLLWCYKV